MQVPSGYFLTDCILRLDELFKQRMLLGGDKLDLAAEEGVKLKKLMGAVRALWRSSPSAHHPRVTEPKNMLRPSPGRQRPPNAAPWPLLGSLVDLDLLFLLFFLLSLFLFLLLFLLLFFLSFFLFLFLLLSLSLLLLLVLLVWL